MCALRRRRLNDRYDIAVVGSGFAGSLMAMIARRLGHSVILLEKNAHPRVVIGESTTPLSNLLLEELATRYDLPALKPLSKWGSWQRAWPDVVCGLKRGFTFHHHLLTSAAPVDPHRNDQLLVAASPCNEIADTHWYRADVDHLLVRQAQELGVEHVDQITLKAISDNNGVITLRGQRSEHDVTFQTSFVIDATGPRGFLYRSLNLKENPLPDYPPTQALYSHFSGVGRLEHTPFARTSEPPPYPIDDAAVHHIFDGGWAWILQFSNGITSAGVAGTDNLASQLRFGDGAAAWSRLLDRVPALREQFAASTAKSTFTHIPRLGFRSSQVVGDIWALLPSAAGFVDPLLSTGFPLTLLGISRLGEIIAEDWSTSRFTSRLQEYAVKTDKELLAVSRLIAGLYSTMSNFPVFIALSLLYFAAATYSETTRRLGKHHLASSFLLCDHPTFAADCARLCYRARQPLTQSQSDTLIRDIEAVITPFNIAGLARPERRNWYPVETSDLLKCAAKLEASHAEIYAMLRRCGFEPTPQS